MRLTYRDEEGDDIAVTTDDELFEAFRLADESKPPLLRLLVAPAGLTTSVSVHSQDLLHSVISNNVGVNSPGIKGSNDLKEATPIGSNNLKEEKVVEKVVEKGVETGIEKYPGNCGEEQKLPNKEKNVNYIKKEFDNPTNLPVVYVSGRAYVPKSNQGAPKPYTGPTKVPGSTNPQERPTIVSITNQLAESISSLVLESSDSTLVSSSLFSDAISAQAEKLSEKTVDSNIEIAQAISYQTHQLANKSEAAELDDAIRRSLSDACYETGINSSKLSDQIAVMTNEKSNQISEDIFPISSSTRNIQDAAIQGLEDLLRKHSDDVVRDIMSATKIN
jgi:hypothetical protein